MAEERLLGLTPALHMDAKDERVQCQLEINFIDCVCGDASVGALRALLPGPAALHGEGEGQQSCLCCSGHLQQRGGGSGGTSGQFCGHDIRCGICINYPWAAQYNTWLLIKLTPKGVVFSFLFFLHKIPGIWAQEGSFCASVFTDLAKLVLKRVNRTVPVALAN